MLSRLWVAVWTTLPATAEAWVSEAVLGCVVPVPEGQRKEGSRRARRAHTLPLSELGCVALSPFISSIIDAILRRDTHTQTHTRTPHTQRGIRLPAEMKPQPDFGGVSEGRERELLRLSRLSWSTHSDPKV